MLLIGYSFSIRSKRYLCEEVHLNLAYRWFCRLGLEVAVPDHSIFSKNRCEVSAIGRFAGNSRSDWFQALIKRFPTPGSSKARLINDSYETAGPKIRAKGESIRRQIAARNRIARGPTFSTTSALNARCHQPRPEATWQPNSAADAANQDQKLPAMLRGTMISKMAPSGPSGSRQSCTPI